MSKNLQSFDDKTLISIFIAGNPAAFGTIVERHQSYLSSVIFPILKDSMLTEDILQEAFIKAITTLQKGEYDEQNVFRAWITRIAHNIAIDFIRKNRRHPTTYHATVNEVDGSGHDFFTYVAGSEISPEDHMILSETEYDIQELMDSLPEEQREVINLRNFQNFSFKEIVDYIGGGISINTALGRHRYGLINLRKKIEDIRNVGQKVI